ncbi:MerR family transcriptional regulator [Lentilactobacillus kosonis]|uniref:Transcriptional regulator, repressor of the glutamine synthetase, MerR family n=1 Tax=Lentilactobacillus kosonis TaxID=2810561 RepID=A0A401FKH9_9LACO|nr:MerR family transcriptional regulator [Lentilactobacillus kosonis]GAY72884.1 transcriptional regulator, repressor of the glutamine synthetase, MerR family [Lentilactobacillus kosonis]
MSEKELRRSLSVLPIGTVMKLTDLSARQIRYYEEQELVLPDRNDGNRRMYSLNDIDRILEIKDYLDEGLNISGIKEVYKKQRLLEEEKKNHQDKQLTDSDVRRILEDEFLHISGLMPPSSTFNNQKL